jgi:hypothetical protein
VARLQGTAVHHARWHEPTEAGTAAAVAELAGILAGRDDGPALLAEVAGLLVRYHDGGIGEIRARGRGALFDRGWRRPGPSSHHDTAAATTTAAVPATSHRTPRGQTAQRFNMCKTLGD